MNISKQRAGFTLLEVLLSLGLLGVIMVSTFNFIDSTTTVASSNNSSNELVREGQIGQQVFASRFKEACYVFPGGTTLSLAAFGFERKNYFTNTFVWTVNTDPFVAMILPPAPDTASDQYRFIAYYAVPRDKWTSVATGGNNPGADTRNDLNTWLIIQYVKPFTSDSTIACGDKPTQTGFAAAITSGSSDILLDYVDIPANRNDLFQVNANSIDYDVRLEKTSSGGTVARVGGPGAESALNGRVYPENLGR